MLYPLVITGIAQLVFPHQANGSLIEQNGQVVGSELIGQSFDDPRYFWGRLSATSPYPYNAAASAGSNLGPTNPALTDEVKARIAALKAADPGNNSPIPVDLVTSSGSGLDPNISVAAAHVPGAAGCQGARAERRGCTGFSRSSYTVGAAVWCAGRTAGQCARAQPGIRWDKIGRGDSFDEYHCLLLIVLIQIIY